MIVNTDIENSYDFQLSKGYDSLRDLWSVMKHFIKDKNKHCCIKKNLKTNSLAVFSSGGYITTPYVKCNTKTWECVDYKKM